jgi:hypothetical protein
MPAMPIPAAAANPLIQAAVWDGAAPISTVCVCPDFPVIEPNPISPLPGGSGGGGSLWITVMTVGNQVEYVPPTHDSYHFVVV